MGSHPGASPKTHFRTGVDLFDNERITSQLKIELAAFVEKHSLH